MNVFFRRIHLYLGLATGLFLVIVCLTGTILVFEDEFTHALHRERYVVEAASTPRLSLAQLTAAVRAAKPKAKINGLKVYADPTRSVEISLAGGGRPGGPQGEPRGESRGGLHNQGGAGRGQQAGDANGGTRAGGQGGRNQAGGPGGKGGKGGDRGPTLFLNPYTGAVLGEFNKQQSFFHFIEEIHRGLVAGRVGKLVMGINSIIFLFILGTGIVLWWPAARNMFTQRLRIKWGSSWKRLNHDFHIVLGFYASLFLFIMAATGVGMSFDWVGKTINTLTHSPQQRMEPPTSAAAAPGTAAFGADAALALARQQAPDAESYAVQLPKEPTGSIQVGILRPGAITERATDDLYLDQHTGQVLRQQTYAQKPVGSLGSCTA
ncbi:MAG: hypothetical protein EOO59_12460 [Hymenobacter sp.]|nr:MAG: hypothetical protein EOO59_12460 [Hymenobacter sp.]